MEPGQTKRPSVKLKKTMTLTGVTTSQGSCRIIVPTVILLEQATRSMHLINVLEYLEMYSKFTTQHGSLCQSRWLLGLLDGRYGFSTSRQEWA